MGPYERRPRSHLPKPIWQCRNELQPRCHQSHSPCSCHCRSISRSAMDCMARDPSVRYSLFFSLTRSTLLLSRLLETGIYTNTHQRPSHRLPCPCNGECPTATGLKSHKFAQAGFITPTTRPRLLGQRQADRKQQHLDRENSFQPCSWQLRSPPRDHRPALCWYRRRSPELPLGRYAQGYW